MTTAVSKHDLAGIDDIKRLAEQIPHAGSLCGLFEGTPKACEAETMVGQTLHASVTNHNEGKGAFSFRGDELLEGRQQCGTNNGFAYQTLLDRGYFVEGEHEGKVTICITQRLVTILDGFLAAKQ